MCEQKSKNFLATKALACCALLAALSVVLARLLIPMPDSTTRFSIEAVPVFLAGMLFGPLAGGLVGFTADFIGCLFSPYGFNPIFSIPPILYGVFGGLMLPLFKKTVNFPRLLLGLLPPVVLGSVLYQSCALAYVYYYETFMEGLLLKLSTRSVQFAITIVLDALVIHLLFKTKIFTRLGLWNPQRRQNNDC